MKDPFEKPKKAAEIVDLWIAKNDLLPSIKAANRFNHTVSLKHKSNRELVFCSAYAFFWEEWFIVISNVNSSYFKSEEINEYSMIERSDKKQVQINRIIIKNNKVQTVPL